MREIFFLVIEFVSVKFDLTTTFVGALLRKGKNLYIGSSYSDNKPIKHRALYLHQLRMC